MLYGSSLSATGIKDSDVNIDLVVPHKANHAKALMQAFKIMKTLGMHLISVHVNQPIQYKNMNKT